MTGHRPASGWFVQMLAFRSVLGEQVAGVAGIIVEDFQTSGISPLRPEFRGRNPQVAPPLEDGAGNQAQSRPARRDADGNADTGIVNLTRGDCRASNFSPLRGVKPK